MKKISLMLAFFMFAPAIAFSQALTSLQSVRVQYNTRKATVRPTGELKVQIDDIDRQIQDAQRTGNNGELRRLMAKGTTLLNGRPWTDVLDFATSLALRTDRIVADSTKPVPIRIAQIYSPSIQLTHSLTAHDPAPAADTGTKWRPADARRDRAGSGNG